MPCAFLSGRGEALCLAQKPSAALNPFEQNADARSADLDMSHRAGFNMSGLVR